MGWQKKSNDILEIYLAASIAKVALGKTFVFSLPPRKQNNNSEPELQAPPSKRKRFLGAGLDEDSEDEGDTEEQSDSAKNELNKYQSEAKLKSSGDPFLWWKARKDQYPLMSCLARKYLSVQATSTAAERVMSQMNIMLDKKRLGMSSEVFEKAMFLSDCV